MHPLLWVASKQTSEDGVLHAMVYRGTSGSANHIDFTLEQFQHATTHRGGQGVSISDIIEKVKSIETSPHSIQYLNDLLTSHTTAHLQESGGVHVSMEDIKLLAPVD